MNIKRFLSILLVLAMTVGLVPGAAFADGAETAETKTITQTNTTATMTVSLTVPEKSAVSYIDADGTTKQTGTDYTYVRESIKRWGDESAAKWYVVDKDVTIAERVTVTGDVHLILCDGATLTANTGITVTGANNSLTIYGQSGGTGALIANGAGSQAGIGGTQGVAGGTVTINGGNITATSAYGGAGIGGGDNGAGGNTTINGGIVNAQGGNGAGIGGGYSGGTGTTIINGGTVTAVGHESPGIGFGEMYMNSYDPLGLTVAEGMTIVAGGGTSDAEEKASASDLNGWSRYIYIEKETPLTDVTYLDEKGDSQTLEAGTSDNPGYTRVRPYTTTWSAGWYVVDKDVTITNQIVVEGDINLILTDGATLTASKGITFDGEGFQYKFTVYGQSAGTGKLTSGEPVLGSFYAVVMTFNGGVIDISVGEDAENKFEASIGAEEIIVNGGSVSGTNANGYRGIKTRSVTINDGTVNAISNVYGSQAIGVDSSSVTVNGGVLNTYGSYRAIDCSDGDVTVNGGSLTARSETRAIFANLTVTGGTVLAEGMKGSYNVGDGVYGNVEVRGGSVTVIGGDGGNGQNGKAVSGSVTINNGLQVKAGDAETDTFVTDYVENHNNYRWAKIAKFHTHWFTDYQLTTTNAKDDTITATCTADLDNCTLEATDYQAKLVILAPTKGGGAATLTGATDFGVTAANIEYYKGNDKLDAAPNEDGFFKAQITVGGKTAYVTYGINEIVKDTAFNASTAHGDFTVPAVATANATVTIATTPDTGYELKEITVTKDNNSTVDAAVDGNNGTFTMPPEKVTVSAEFQLHDYIITKSNMTNGSVTVAETAQMDDTVTVTVNPATGYELDTLKYGITDITATEGVYSFKMPASDVTISATFKKINYTITNGVDSTTAHGSVTVAATAQMDDTVTVTVNPDAGYELSELEYNNTEITADGEGKYKFTMPAADTNISASFKKRNVAVSVNVEGNENTTCTAKVLNDDFTTAEQPLTKQVGDTFTLLVSRDDDYDFIITVGANDVSMTEFTKEEYKTYLEYADKNGITVPANTVLKHVIMPGVVDNSITLTITFAKQCVFTILYKPDNSSTSQVWCKFDKTEAGNTKVTDAIRMKSDAVMGDGTAVYSLKVKAGFEPTKVDFATASDGFGSNTMTNISIIQKAPTEDNDWTNVSGGKAVVIGGSAKTVIAAFISDADSMQVYKDNNLEQAAVTEGVDYRLAVVMDGSTATVTAPDTPTKEGYTFKGWRGYKYDTNGMASEQVYTALSPVPVRANTTLSAVWEPVTPNVKFNLNNGEGSTSTKVNYRDTITKPENIEKIGFILEGWTVGNNVTENGKFFSKNSTFDFNTAITEDIELNAKWKHVHSYTCVPIDYSAFGNALEKYYKYLPYLHIEFCGCADVHIVAHTFNESGLCTGCGYTKPGSTEAKLEVFYWKDGDSSAWMREPQRTVKRNEEVVVDAFWQIGDYQFSRWQYSTDNGQTWADLAADTMVGFIIPCSMQVRALYVSTITEPQLNLSARNYVTQAQGYNWDSVLFQMNYKLPEGYTLVDAGVRMGDNAGISYYEMKERNITMDNEAKAIATGICVVTSILGGDINTYESSATETYYAERENSVLQEMTAATLAEYMLKFKPVNVEKYPPIYWESAVTTKNRTGSVNTLTPLRFIQKNNGNHYIYGMAYLTYKDSDGVQHTIYTDAIPVTRNQPTGTAANTHTLAN